MTPERNKFGSILKWLGAFVVFAFPPIYLAYDPKAYTPLVEVLLGLFLFLMAYWLGYTQETQRATQRANDRWLPQAESVILRLMTLRANVCRFSRTTKSSCGSAACELPELRKDELRAVRIKMKTDCEASSQRLDDIAHQLEDAIEDWRRFVAANCQGEECNRIFEALQQRDESLLQEIDPETNRVERTAAPSVAFETPLGNTGAVDGKSSVS